MIRKATVEGGTVVGIPAADPRVTAFKGIPFAAPPVGKNRWRAPQPVIPWEGEKQCWNFAPISMQHIPGLDQNNIYSREWNVDPSIPMDEDCLYLNIWTPAKSTDEKLPVYVWYFGGGLREGNPAEMEFDGERYARRGIVFVSVNYRLNVFGFLAHPQLTKEQPDAPSNFGHLDQQYGTQWVKRNIAAFGGDPNNITIGGQSAGGSSVMAQIASPQNLGLFQRAIVESGLFCNVYPNQRRPGGTPSLESGEKLGERFFEFLGVKPLAEARAIDEKTLLKKTMEFRGHWGTVVDGAFLPGDPIALFMKNQRVPGPVLWGCTASEFFHMPNVQTTEEFKALAKDYFAEDGEKFLKLFDLTKDSPEALNKKAAVSSIDFSVQVVSEQSIKNGNPDALYYYQFDAEIPGWDHPGTFHSVDLWFFFETLAKCWRPFVGKHYDLARQMCNYWAYFMKNGDPNGPDADGTPMPRWDAYTPENNACMVFGDVAKEINEKPSRLEEILMRRHLKQRGF